MVIVTVLLTLLLSLFITYKLRQSGTKSTPLIVFVLSAIMVFSLIVVSSFIVSLMLYMGIAFVIYYAITLSSNKRL